MHTMYTYCPVMLVILFSNNDHVSADMEVAEERSPAMTDSSEGEVNPRNNMMISKTILITMIAKEGEEEQEDLGGRSFLNILSVLAGRNSLGLARWQR